MGSDEIRLDATEDTDAPRADTIRLDASAAVRTDEGFLRVPARITRTGIMEYYRMGRVVRELRRPEQVFRQDSVDTLRGVPLTMPAPGAPHAVEFVTARDTQKHAVGYVASDVEQDGGRYLSATLHVWRADAVEAIEHRKLTEVSAGYRSKIKLASGVWQGQAYDIEQTDVRYNHVALLPPGVARGGSELAIRLDAHDLITLLRDRLTALGLPDAELATALGLPDADGVRLLLDGDLGLPSAAILTRAAGMIHMPVADLLTMAAPESPPIKVSGMKRQIVINGVTFEVELPETLAGSFDAAVSADRAAAEQVRTDAADAATKLTEVEAERDKIKAERDALQTRCDAIELDRVRDQARAVHPDVKGETVRELHMSVLTHLGHADAVRTDASDAEIAGMFALALKQAPSDGPRTVGTTPAPGAATRTDAEDRSADAARARMQKRNREAWRQAE